MNLQTTKTKEYLIYSNTNKSKKKKIACFDLDHTIIKPKDSKVFYNHNHDYIFYSSDIKQKLQKFIEDGFKLIFISNQLSLKTDEQFKSFDKKIRDVFKKLDLELTLYCSLQKDKYRKPNTGFWDEFINPNNQIDLSKSFYCGDAGGADKTKYTRKDFSNTDYKFALNIGIDFIHRNKFIYNIDSKLNLKYVDFDKIKKSIKEYVYPKYLKSDKQELVIMIGRPGSGKTHYCINYIIKPHNYIYINQDLLGSFYKCKTLCKRSLKDGSSVVIDNTNPSSKTRNEYIKIVNDLNLRDKIKIVFIEFNTSEDLCKHNVIYRMLTDQCNNKNKVIPQIVYNMYKKKYDKPTLKIDDYDEYKVHNFIINKNMIDKELYYKYLY